MMGTGFAAKRAYMVDCYIRPVVSDQRVIAAFSMVPRHFFVPKKYRQQAYEDIALPIGYDQTISQPSLVAEMTALLQLTGNETMLEVGTGSGYQAAILSLLVKWVYTIERIPQLANQARQRLAKLKLTNVTVAVGNGVFGLPDKAPFDDIIVSASCQKIPEALQTQLKDQGKIEVPMGENFQVQRLKIGIKKQNRLELRDHEYVQFVPLINSVCGNMINKS